MPHLPKPFKRPGITISDGSPKRTWDFTPVTDIQPGDIVADFGEVEFTEKASTGPQAVCLINVMGVSATWNAEHSVYAFSHRG